MPSAKASREEINLGSQDALAEAISNLDAVDAQSVAGLLDAYLDKAISSRSSHDWDPDGVIPSTGTVATQSDTGGTDWTTKTSDRPNLPLSTTNTYDPSAGGTATVKGLSVTGGGWVQYTEPLPIKVDFNGDKNTIGTSAFANEVTIQLAVDGTPIQSKTVVSSSTDVTNQTFYWDRPATGPLTRFGSEFSVQVFVDWDGSNSDDTSTDVTCTQQRTDSSGTTYGRGYIGLVMD